MKAVVDINQSIVYMGTHTECILYMSSHDNWDDLMHLTPTGAIGRYASWKL